MSNHKQAQLLRESLRILVRKLGIMERDDASCCELTLSQCQTIVEIGRMETVTVNVLAEMLGVDNSTVSRSVDKLVHNGILLRAPDPKDRRAVILRLSEKGQSVFTEVEKRTAVYFEEVIAAIPCDKREQIIDSLHYLVQALKDHRCC